MYKRLVHLCSLVGHCQNFAIVVVIDVLNEVPSVALVIIHQYAVTKVDGVHVLCPMANN